MKSRFKIEKIFTDEEIKNLHTLFDSIPAEHAHQDYNLFDVEKRSIPFSQWSSEIHKLNQFVDKSLDPVAHYFVKYNKDSFTRRHTDNDKIVSLTVITMIEQSDLVGGETLVFNTYDKKARPKYKYAKRLKSDGASPIGKDIIPVIVRANDGDSIIYDASTVHAVTHVEQGHRIVLVSWFK